MIPGNMFGVLVPLLLCAALTAAQTLVNIPGVGSVQGSTGLTYFTNRTIYEFKGIPFAERPVRFMPPTNKAAWEGVLDATSFGRICPQSDILTGTDDGDLEDCLTLNIYTPQASNATKLPVLFYIHGGAYVHGSSRGVRPGFFLENDIVLVAPQYRVGPLGFLSLGTEQVKGNAAMYDQLLALQWTYDNIQYFGGDRDKITVSGVSAGAASASLQYVSPLTQDLIKQAILFSGSAVALWTVGTEPVSHSLSIAKHSGCEATAIEDVISCLQNADVRDIVRGYDQYESDEETNAHSGRDGTNPVVDGHFLTEMPLETLSNPNFNGRPLIVSVAKHEGMMFEQTLYNKYLVGNNLTNDFNTLKYNIPDVLLSYANQEDTSCTVATAIKDEYFKPEEFGNYTLMKAGITDFLGAAYFKGPGRKMAELNSLRGGPTYIATYNYYSPGSHMNGVVPHGGDQRLLFPVDGYDYTQEDLSLARNLTTIYSNFVITGTPSGVNWEPYTLENGIYLIINSTMKTSSPFEEQYTIAEQEGLYKN